VDVAQSVLGAAHDRDYRLGRVAVLSLCRQQAEDVQRKDITTPWIACTLAALLVFWPIPDDDPCVVAALSAPEQEQSEAVPVGYIAGIVAGEASNVPDARLAVACTALRDWRAGQSLSKRWYGWREPSAADYAAVDLALKGACQCFPHFRFVGSARDWDVWKSRGWVEGDPSWQWGNGEWIIVATE